MKDLGSLNGTYVNGQPVVEVSLSSGDEIQIGKFHMLFFGGKS
jgi:pSer/pThr/pTyr-binding forkhead associated (FHA) protein